MNNDLHEAFNHLAYLCLEGKIMSEQRNVGACFVVDATNAMKIESQHYSVRLA